MREIKFRAWDTARNEMHYDWMKITTHISASEDKHEFYSVFYKGFSAPQDHVIAVMQYTGLKDKNGKEIYEGDIVKVNGGAEDVFFEVSFEDGCFIAKVPWVDGKEVHYPELKMYIGWKFIPIYEVIGNIYENPELLEQK